MTFGLNLVQVKELVVRPVLTKLNLGGETAVNLVFGTALVETHLSWIRQYLSRKDVLNGTGRGLWQLEPATIDWLYNDLMARPKHNARLRIIKSLYMTGENLHQQMITNMSLGAIFCRFKYLSSSSPMCKNNANDMYEYHKRIYNAGGAATDKNIAIFQTAIDT